MSKSNQQIHKSVSQAICNSHCLIDERGDLNNRMMNTMIQRILSADIGERLLPKITITKWWIFSSKYIKSTLLSLNTKKFISPFLISMSIIMIGYAT